MGTDNPLIYLYENTVQWRFRPIFGVFGAPPKPLLETTSGMKFEIFLELGNSFKKMGTMGTVGTESISVIKSKS